MNLTRFSLPAIPGLIALLPLVSAFILPAHQKKSGPPPAEQLPFITAVDNVVKEEMARQNIYGVTVGVVQNGVITHLKAYGHTNRERTKALTTGTVLRWASISKTLTAVAVYKAMLEGKMALQDKVTKHVSNWPATGNKGDITIDHLLIHRSGITHYGNDENGKKICSYNMPAYTASKNFNAGQCVNVFKNCDLFDTPGSEFCYSTSGYNLLGAAVEGATGIPYEKYVLDSIAAKANMTTLDPYFNDPGGLGKDCNGIVVNKSEGGTEWKLPGGGWSSNIGDLTRFMQGLINNSFITLSAALYVPAAGKDITEDYLHGVKGEKLGSDLFVSHGGDQDDVETYMGYFPWKKDGVCIMIPAGSYPDKSGFAKKILDAIGYNWNVTGLPVDYCGDEDNCGHTVTAVWRKTDKAHEVLIRRGLTGDEFKSEREVLEDAGYYAEDLDTWMDGLVRKWDCLFRKTTLKSAVRRDLGSDDFHDAWEKLANDGFRLVDLETYLDGVVRKWAGTFIESSDKWALFRNLSPDAFHDKHEEMKGQNYKLVNIECYHDGFVKKWAGVWKGSGVNLVNRDMSEQQFKDMRTDREKDGYKLIDIETYVDGTVRKWAGVWEKLSGDEHFSTGIKMCDLVNNKHNPDKKNGYELVDIEKH